MKKMYLPLCSFLMSAIAALSFSGAQAQCSAYVQNINYDNGGACAVKAFEFPPNVNVALLSSTGAIISSAVTNEFGDVTIPYACGLDVYQVSTCVGSGGTITCCEAYVPVASILPMKVTSFSANLNANNSVSLNWVSSLELSSYKYVVQKSADGKNFNDIGEIPAAGNSVHDVKYNFSDGAFTAGTSYFRLKQVDKDGRVEFSKVVYVNNKKIAGLVKSVAPNPFVSEVQLIGINSSEVIPANIKVFSSFGQAVSYRITGANSIAIDPAAPKGLYLLQVKGQVLKLLKN